MAAAHRTSHNARHRLRRRKWSNREPSPIDRTGIADPKGCAMDASTVAPHAEKLTVRRTTAADLDCVMAFYMRMIDEMEGQDFDVQ